MMLPMGMGYLSESLPLGGWALQNVGGKVSFVQIFAFLTSILRARSMKLV
jgi:hypothetical protein